MLAVLMQQTFDVAKITLLNHVCKLLCTCVTLQLHRITPSLLLRSH